MQGAAPSMTFPLRVTPWPEGQSPLQVMQAVPTASAWKESVGHEAQTVSAERVQTAALAITSPLRVTPLPASQFKLHEVQVMSLSVAGWNEPIGQVAQTVFWELEQREASGMTSPFKVTPWVAGQAVKQSEQVVSESVAGWKEPLGQSTQ